LSGNLFDPAELGEALPAGVYGASGRIAVNEAAHPLPESGIPRCSVHGVAFEDMGALRLRA
jgi:hypothetical protein